MTPDRKCPWCRTLPTAFAPLNPADRPIVVCGNLRCKVRPRIEGKPGQTLEEIVGIWDSWGDDRPARAPKIPKPKKGGKKKPVLTSADVSPEGLQFADWWKAHIYPPEAHDTENWRVSWAQVYDTLILQGRPPAAVWALAHWLQSDPGDGAWWRSRMVQTPHRLIRPNPDRILYFDVIWGQKISPDPRRSARRPIPTVPEPGGVRRTVL